jgi:signal transduction histidine kinase
MAERITPTLKAVSDAVLAVAARLSVEEVLQRLVESARELARARYAALGIPDGEGGFSQFLTAGMSEELVASLGPLPRQHGVLGAMLEEVEPYRTPDLHDDPRFRGWWPAGHPDMRSFLGVPIVAREAVIGAFYLTDKLGAPDFTDDDEDVIELLAAHAAIAITNARLYEQSRELSILSERNRLALDLHDAVSQRLFGLVLAAESAETLLDRDPGAAREQVAKLKALAQEAREELRSLVFELRPPDLERDGLCGALRKHVEIVQRSQPIEVRLELDAGLDREPARDQELLRVAQEAINNSLRHARAEHLAVRLQREEGRLVLEVQDDGVGFDPAARTLRATHLGLTSMEERARRVGGSFEIDSAPGAGTRVRVEAPGG